MNEPNYIFRKGTGWMPEPECFLLSQEDCKDWEGGSYPPVIQDWSTVSGYCQIYKLGDVIPFSGRVGVVVEIVYDGLDQILTIRNLYTEPVPPVSSETPEQFKVRSPEYWGVRRKL